MSTEDNIEEITPSEGQNSDKRKTKKRRIFLGFAIASLFLLGLCIATGVLNLNFNLYGGGISIENLVITDELSESGELINPPQDTFEATEKVIGLITTTGIDASVGMRWYHENELIYEQLGRTIDNKFATHIEGSSLTPLPSGEYRVEAFIGRGDPIKTATFTVKEFELVLEVNPPQPVPSGHEDIENAPYVEVPFVFDEVWEIDGEELKINEVKITFFKDDVLFVIVVDSEIASNELSETEARELSRPIAEYAIENGYYEKAEGITINGIQYDFDELNEPVVVTLYNRTYGGGFRTRFNVEDLSN